ncbi:MAG: hypothetical protein MUF49_14790 [Oculatellaceae cyanobacterium Prado106]|jgi:hypothetical protein|nr:hypothetical protein [Oculatellaceae cyanobacterium Prado106]
MQPDLQALKITSDDLDKLTGLDISDTFMGRVYRPSVLRQWRRLRSLLVTELLAFCLILVFCLPVSLMIARSFGFVGGAVGTFWFLLLTGGLSVAIALAWNFYMWSQTKQLKILAHLLDEVDKHNDIIQAVHIMDELGAVKNLAIVPIDRDEVMEALNATRDSLVSGLAAERILRKHRQFIARRHELFNNIETNLARLQNLQITNQANEYGQLLNEALRIGRSVYREMERFQD